MATREGHPRTDSQSEPAFGKPNHDLLPLDTENDEEQARHAVMTLDTSNQKPLNETKRFAMLTAAVFAMICASTSYAYNSISKNIQDTYSLKFRDMSNISTVGMVFAYFLLPYGTILDYFGPRPIYTLGCVLFPLGALLFGLTFQGVLSGSVVRFCVYNALLSLGSQLFDLASVIVLLSVFPTRRGWVIALLKTMMGLGQAIIASIKVGFFSAHTAYYFYFLIALVVAVGVAVQALVVLPPYHLTGWERKRLSPEKKAKRLATMGVYLKQNPPMWRFYFGVAVLCVLIVYLPLTSALSAFVSMNATAPRTFAIVAIVVTCLLLLMIVPCPPLDRRTTKVVEEEEDAGSVQKVVETDIDYIAPQYQTTFLQSCRTPELWCILWTMFCGVGAEFVIIFNASYIYAAMSGTKPDNTVAALLTVLNGAGSALGRLAMCVVETRTQNRKAEDRIPITFSFFIPTSCIILSIVLFLVLPGRALLLAFTIAALGNGFCASVTILVLRTIYAKDPAKHYNFGYNALWIAAILLNRLLFGEWYAVRVAKESGLVCLKKGCVIMPLVVMLGLNCLAFLSDVFLHIKYTRYSRRVLAERRRIKEEAALAEPTYVDEDGNAIEKPGKLQPTEGVHVGVDEEMEDSDENDNGSLHDDIIASPQEIGEEGSTKPKAI